MSSRRDQIRMSQDELLAFLEERKIMSVATMGPNGRPHLVPLWYVPHGLELRGWTYAKSQKARNLERDPRATVQVEDGVQYDELRGVMFECEVEIERGAEHVEPYGLDLFRRYGGDGELPDEVREMVRGQAGKRVGLTFRPTRTVSWDHSKLGGTY